MLECLALEDVCVQTVWNWIYENWSWGLFVAVVSLWYAAKSYSKSYKSNKLSESSLDLTARSTALAEESLNEAKKSIDTSIDLYNQQKRDAQAERLANEEKATRVLKENLKHVLLGLIPIGDNFTNFINSDADVDSYEYLELDSNLYIYSDSESFTINSFESSVSSLNMLVFDATKIDISVHENISIVIFALEHFQRTTIPSIKRCLKNNMTLKDIKAGFKNDKNVWDAMLVAVQELVDYTKNKQ